MSTQELYPWLVFAHILGAFIFAGSHGVSVWLTLRLRQERDPTRIASLVALSTSSFGALYAGLALLLIGGIAAGIVGGHFGRPWIWVSLGLLIAVTVAMYAVATPYFIALRRAVGAPVRGDPGTGVPTMSPEELEALVSRNPAGLLATIGFGGFISILWLMVFKPF